MVKPKTSSVFEIDVYDTLMREVKHLTTGTANDRMNVSPIWSKDGKFIVYTQEQSKGTDSNVFLVMSQRPKHAADAPRRRAPPFGKRHFAGRQTRFDHIQRRQRIPERRPAGHRQQEKSLAHSLTSGKFRAAAFPPTTPP